MTDAARAARQMWTLFEPVHAITYFAPEARSAFADAGLSGFWRGYFAGRAAPLGRVGAAPVTAAFFSFAPAMVARALPAIWDLISPEAALQARSAGAVAALARLLAGQELPAPPVPAPPVPAVPSPAPAASPPAASPLAASPPPAPPVASPLAFPRSAIPPAASGPAASGPAASGLAASGPVFSGRNGDLVAAAAAAASLLTGVIDGIDCAGRVLAAANAALPVPGEPLARLWHAVTVLREHRGDGHVAALVAAGLDGCEALVMRAGMDLSRGVLQPGRGWADDAWDLAAARLADRGWLGPDGRVTAEGAAAHRALEQATDLAAARPWARLGPEATAELLSVLTPVAKACAAALPYPNPVGIPAPETAPVR